MPFLNKMESYSIEITKDGKEYIPTQTMPILSKEQAIETGTQLIRKSKDYLGFKVVYTKDVHIQLKSKIW